MNTNCLACAIFAILAASILEVEGRPPTKIKKIIDLAKQDFFQGDILISSPTARNGILKNKKWPNGKIPYVHGENWTESQLDMIRTAMKTIEASTCVKFVERTNEKNYVITKNTSLGCFSDGVGMKGGAQIVSYMDTEWFGSCFVHRVVIHELLHAVGLWHEHARYDRDDHVKIHWENVQNNTKARHNMELIPSVMSNTYGIPYNYKSVMHYDKLSWSKNEQVTMETLDPEYADVIGKSEYAHELDLEKVRRIYNCKGVYATVTPPPTTTVDPNACIDQFAAMCATFAEHCETEDWMKGNCKKTCGECS